MNADTLKYLREAKELLELAARSLRSAHNAESAVALSIDEFLSSTAGAEKAQEIMTGQSANDDDEDMFS